MSRDYLNDWSFFAEIMSICALSSAKAMDESLIRQWALDDFKGLSSEDFYAAAKELVPQMLSDLRSLEWMRTCAMLALYGLHTNKLDVMHQYLGTYLNIVTMDGLHDEENWPKDIGVVEVEMRRRLVCLLQLRQQ